MTSVTRLSRILRSAPSDRALGRSASDEILTFRGFLAGTAAWRDAALKLPAEQRENAVLYAEDAVPLLPALFGLWAAGVHVVLPGDALPGTLERLERGGVTLNRTILALDAVRMDEAGRVRTLAVPMTITEMNSAPVPDDLPLLDDHAELLSLLTSGSTGEPKLVRKRLDQGFWEPEAIDAGLRAFIDTDTDGLGEIEVLGTVSAQHIYGMLFRLFWPLMAANAVLHGPRLHFPETLEAALLDVKARGHKAVIIAAPAHLKRFTDPALFAPSLGTVSVVFTSTGPLDEAGALCAARAFGHFPIEVLGSTETGGIAWRMRAPAAPGEEKLITPPWRTVEGIEAAVRLENGETLPAGEGLICLRGRHLEREDWIEGSDRIRLDETGFTLLGRADRIVKIEGKRVALPEVEALLEKSGLVRRARVLALNEHGRDLLAAVLEPTAEMKTQIFSSGKAAVTSKLRELLKADLPAVAVPRRWRFVDEFPANAQGKTTVAALLALFDARRPEWLLESDVTEGDKRTITLRLEASPGLEWLKGHFPGLPILPGVAQLLLVEKAVREFAAVSEDWKPGTVKQLKFRAVTTPGMRLALKISLPAKLEAEKWSLKFEWISIEGENQSIQSNGSIDWINSH
ncbi:AMP-binding protein [Sutterella sp.]|uniref:AMP-binding protein n=1 Tax=Sutterella sp. TaxID=1981025 RepID=UPI0026DFFD6B|nr:AMP-binding protein [Sutterella sp.]MDO5530950.1 AMP-binding protein [Sutterella sp.]